MRVIVVNVCGKQTFSHGDGGESSMTRSLVRGILGLVLAAAATLIANKVVEAIFGPEESA
jgi:hypothetical protein